MAYAVPRQSSLVWTTYSSFAAESLHAIQLIALMPALSSLAVRIGLDTRLRLDGQGAPVLDAEAGEAITSSTPDVDLLLGEEPSPSGRGTLHVTTK